MTTVHSITGNCCFTKHMYGYILMHNQWFLPVVNMTLCYQLLKKLLMVHLARTGEVGALQALTLFLAAQALPRYLY